MSTPPIDAQPTNDLTVPANDVLRCSAKGCRATAAFALEWNNPKLHAPDRRKTWLACGDHRTTLSEFLDRRGFLRDVRPL